MTADDGTPVTGRGYGLHDRNGEVVFGDHLTFSSYGCRVLSVAGVSRRKRELQREAFAPGKVLTLVPEPNNSVDRNAIGVWDADRRLQIGYIPATETASIHGALKRHGELVVLSLWEIVNPQGERGGLRILVLQPNTEVEMEGAT